MNHSALLALCVAAGACGGDDDEPENHEPQIVYSELSAALLSVWGSGTDDVWSVGGDPTGDGPLVLHLTDGAWNTVDTGSPGDLWWVFGAEGTVFAGGAGGRILVSDDGESFSEMTTPSTTPIVFGIWGCSADDVWAVGGNQGGAMGGFAWHLEGDEWVQPDDFPADIAGSDAVWKVTGAACDDVWMVGTNGLAIHWNGDAFDEPLRIAGESLFTDASDGELTVAVGGFGTGAIYEHDGADWGDNQAPADADALVGVCTGGGQWYASGWYGALMSRADDGTWAAVEPRLALDATLHSCWVDGDGGLWAVGGQVVTLPLTDGVMVHLGDEVPMGTNE
jgi:hypothetical protein